MKVSRYILCLCVAIVLFTTTAFAGDSFSKVGTAGAQFLKMGVGARYAAIGEASVAMADDGYALYWNPAGLASLAKSHVEFTNIGWVDGVNLNYIAYVRPTAIGSFGVSVTAMTSGNMEITTVDQPDGTGRMFSTSSYAVALGYARQMTEYFSFGLSAKYVSERISEEHASGIAFDFGTLLRPGYKNLRIGMNISNLGPQLKFGGPELNFRYNPAPDNSSYDKSEGVLSVDPYELPLIFRIGAAYDLQYSQNSRLTFSVEARDPSDARQQGSIGTEVSFYNTFFLRGGWKINYDEERLSLGGGLSVKAWQNSDLSVNYAWADFGRLETVHRFSFGFTF